MAGRLSDLRLKVEPRNPYREELWRGATFEVLVDTPCHAPDIA
jgi:hypothetical protein